MAQNQTSNPWLGVWLSFLGFVIPLVLMWILHFIPIPYLGILGIVFILMFHVLIGGILGLVLSSFWNLFFTALFTIGGSTLGLYFQKGEYSIFWICVAFSLFSLSYKVGSNWAKKVEADPEQG